MSQTMMREAPQPMQVLVDLPLGYRIEPIDPSSVSWGLGYTVRVLARGVNLRCATPTEGFRTAWEHYDAVGGASHE